jgi:Fe-S cluster assembly protein SufD
MAEINPIQKFFEPIDEIASSSLQKIKEIPDKRLRDFRKFILEQYEASKTINPKVREWKRLISQPAIESLKLIPPPMIKEFDSPRLPGSKEDYAGVASLEDAHISYWVKDDLRKQNVEFCHINKALSEGLVNDPVISQIKEMPRKDRFSILAAGLGNHSVCLKVPDHTIIKSPFLIKIDQQRGNFLMPVFINIFLGEGSEADIIIEGGSSLPRGEQSLISVELNVFAGDCARMGLVESQQFNPRTQLFLTECIFLKDGASANYLLIEKGSGLVKRNLIIDMNGANSEATITGLYQPGSTQEFVYDTHQNHNASQTKSDLMFKGVLDKNAYSLWQGNIFVAKGTTGADGYQVNNNLLLDRKAHAESIPGLEIIADDVRCSHGVTLSNIDQDQLFYLKSRGIDETNGKQLIVDGFIRDALQRVQSPKMVEFAKKSLGFSGFF